VATTAICPDWRGRSVVRTGRTGRSAVYASVVQKTRGRYRLVHPRPRAAVVELHGEHDLTTSERLRQIFTTLVVSHDLVVADLSEAGFIDSSVLSAFVEAHRKARESGSRFCLQLGTEQIVLRALEITQLLDRLEHYSTREEALAAEYAPLR
jgi:anti-anti-sigma factor